MKLVMVVGAATPPGRLNNAVDHLAAALAQRSEVTTEILALAGAGVEICDGRSLEAYGEATRAAVALVDSADAVIFASPVYRASFPGVLKNLLDQLPVDALRDKPVGIVAMGGSPHHYLGVDSHMRMVLAWFGALTAPNSVYLTGKDFAEGKLSTDSAKTDLMGLAETLLILAEAREGRNFGPIPLAARYT